MRIPLHRHICEGHSSCDNFYCFILISRVFWVFVSERKALFFPPGSSKLGEGLWFFLRPWDRQRWHLWGEPFQPNSAPFSQKKIKEKRILIEVTTFFFHKNRRPTSPPWAGRISFFLFFPSLRYTRPVESFLFLHRRFSTSLSQRALTSVHSRFSKRT